LGGAETGKQFEVVWICLEPGLDNTDLRSDLCRIGSGRRRRLSMFLNRKGRRLLILLLP
jgi:hypothetical protein